MAELKNKTRFAVDIRHSVTSLLEFLATEDYSYLMDAINYFTTAERNAANVNERKIASQMRTLARTLSAHDNQSVTRGRQ